MKDTLAQDFASYWTNDYGRTRMVVEPERGLVTMNAEIVWKLLIDAGYVPCTPKDDS